MMTPRELNRLWWLACSFSALCILGEIGWVIVKGSPSDALAECKHHLQDATDGLTVAAQEANALRAEPQHWCNARQGDGGYSTQFFYECDWWQHRQEWGQ